MLPNPSFGILHWLFRPGTFSHWIEIIKIVGAASSFSGSGSGNTAGTRLGKRLEFVATEMKNFYDDPAVKAALTMLDWRKKTFALFKFRNENDSDQVTVDYKTVASALGIDPDLKYDKVQSAIRETFERFLEFLARLKHSSWPGLSRGMTWNPYLDYWMKLISGRDGHSPEATKEKLPSLWKFIDYFGYQDVRHLINRYQAVAFAEFKE